jgi:hypothetical protein
MDRRLSLGFKRRRILKRRESRGGAQRRGDLPYYPLGAAEAPRGKVVRARAAL